MCSPESMYHHEDITLVTQFMGNLSLLRTHPVRPLGRGGALQGTFKSKLSAAAKIIWKRRGSRAESDRQGKDCCGTKPYWLVLIRGLQAGAGSA